MDLPHLKCPLSVVVRRVLSSFRLGFSKLKVYDHSISRMERKCDLCNSSAIEDEQHVLFECRFYRYVRKDRKWSDLYCCTTDIPAIKRMHAFMNQPNQYKLAHYIAYLLEMRRSRCNIDFFNSDSD